MIMILYNNFLPFEKTTAKEKNFIIIDKIDQTILLQHHRLRG